MKKAILIFMLFMLATAANALVVSVRPTYLGYGTEEEIYVQVYNNGKDDLENVQVSLYLPELGIYEVSRNFDVDDGKVSGVRMFIETPKKAYGFSPMRVTVMGDKVSYTEWAWVSFY